ncbi:leucyl/phenylalanyl-tRNA--protein transferase [Croceitalea vernalis]|uniref:Leucyl/phenylalanyl-tRNA--protein transferase n=1 Tax=Croceitalea vernalis TaxID=3075599 RepID=A0ABU3BDQ7_9FLAO|nr:leucyl/phenylalanyl-tRNA--protein transferase [Croceitalea sp. P007]MDT0620162.1 leucyl/phenylalanyl-tRNA--protein transferase [Croceitalea sp. P007]
MENNGKNKPLFFLNDRLEFPPVSNANPEGLLAVGGDLSPERLLLAYQNGIFPWFNEDALILWWSPDPRMVLFPDKLKVSKSMRKIIASNQFELTKNKCFDKVIEHCSVLERKGQEGTWITPKMKEAYLSLHEKGFAKSYEVWQNSNLVGGLYGIDLGHVFCGESMFSLVSNASKFAFIHMVNELRNESYKLIDCQVYTQHLESLGAQEMARDKFMQILHKEN